MSDEDLIDAWASPRGPGPSAPIDPLHAAHGGLNAMLGVGTWSIQVRSREARPAITLTWSDGGRTHTAIAGTLDDLVAAAEGR